MIRVFAGDTCHFVGFVMSWLQCIKLFAIVNFKLTMANRVISGSDFFCKQISEIYIVLGQ